jgi:uncharacterized protein YabN with tetrapyrrole methylase and pyrophosphatase domain
MAQELTRKAAKQGFEWPALGDVWSKLSEELGELREATELDGDERTRRIEDELGDVLFATSNLARWLGIDAESALRVAGAKFRRRFLALEQRAQDQPGGLSALSIDTLLALWSQAKATDRV